MSDVTKDPAGSVESSEAEQLRRRIKELEDRLASEDRSGRAGKSPSGSSGAMTVLAALLGAMAALMAWPAFLTVRRWVRWWRD